MDIICSFADKDNALIHLIVGAVIGWPWLIWKLAYHQVCPRVQLTRRSSRDRRRYPYDMPWDWVRDMYRDLKNEDGRYNEKVIALILFVLPSGAFIATLPSIIFLFLMMAVNGLVC